MNKTTEALKLAEEAFTQAILKMQKQDWKSNYPSELKRSQKALATIRAARAQEQAGHEPVAWMQIGIGDCEGTTILTARLPIEYNTEWWKFEPLYAAPQPDMNLNCKSVQKRLATSWGYAKAEQAEQEPLMDYERINALREGEQNGAEDAYFFVRPENDTPSLRKMFCQGFERGFHKGLKYAAPVQQVDLTDDELEAIYLKCNTPSEYTNAVIAAFKEKNK